MLDPDLNKLRELLARHPDCAKSRPTKLAHTLQGFVSANEDAGTSANYQSDAPDRLDEIADLLGSPAVQANDDVLLRVLKSIKILSRKLDNRTRLGPLIASDLVAVLNRKSPASVAGEAANVVLNICYERANVTLIMDAGGVPPLVKFLDRDQELQANAAGAIQSICFQKEGRQYLRELGAVPAILPLLSSPSLKVRTRAVGAVHNISSEAEAIRIIRRLHAIGTAEISPRSRRGPLVELLRVPNATVCGSAAGALQNLSRESHARDEIHELGAITPLTDLLFGEDVQAQVCAAGAILNVIGPEVKSEGQPNPRREAFKKILSLAISIGMLHGSVMESTAMPPAT